MGITRRCVQLWQSSDVFSFRKRLEDAHLEYAESLETDFDNWVNESKHNTQIARIFRLKAVWPEKYREEVKVLNTDASVRMLDMLRELGKKELEAIEGESKALEAPAVEGEYRELPGPAAGPPRPGPGHVAESGPGRPPTPPERAPGPPLDSRPPAGAPPSPEPPRRPPRPKGQSWQGPNEPSGPPPREVKRI